MIKEGTNPYFVKELETGYVVIGDPQFYRGYSILICKYPKHELHELDSETKMKFLRDMSILAEAVHKAFNPKKLNYELLGNSEPHMHWHIFPRYEDDPLPTKPIWCVDEKIRNVILSNDEMEKIKSDLLVALNKVCDESK